MSTNNTIGQREASGAGEGMYETPTQYLSLRHMISMNVVHVYMFVIFFAHCGVYVLHVYMFLIFLAHCGVCDVHDILRTSCVEQIKKLLVGHTGLGTLKQPSQKLASSCQPTG
jgi:hypothetical protein